MLMPDTEHSSRKGKTSIDAPDVSIYRVTAADIPVKTLSLEIKHTFGHVDCPACDGLRDRIMGHDPDALRTLLFTEAALKWHYMKSKYLKPRTAYQDERHIANLSQFFGKMLLKNIHLGHIREYQEWRGRNACLHGVGKGSGCEHGCTEGLWTRPCGASLINHELSALQQILKHAGLWEKFGDFYRPLKEPSWRPPKVMTDEEEIRLLKIAERHPEWELAFIVANISLNTSATGTELRNLRFRDLDLESRVPSVAIIGDHLKRDVRTRIITLNDSAQAMFRRAVSRARALGSFHPDHFIFPFRESTNHWNPTKPASASWLRKQWDGMREAVGLPWLTPHCLRHQCITLMYEAGVDDETIRHTAGHHSQRMSRWYSHNRKHKQMNALDMIDPTKRFGPQSEKASESRWKRA